MGTDLARKPHPYQAEQRDWLTVPRCATCGMEKCYRSHQPLWWRVLHRRLKWR
jgi:hypothetical protein